MQQTEYKSRHDGGLIHEKVCKKLKFDVSNNLYMHKPEYVLENERHKNLWDFEAQTYQLISSRWQNVLIVNENREPAEY